VEFLERANNRLYVFAIEVIGLNEASCVQIREVRARDDSLGARFLDLA
jgi:hypothetical protein